MVPKDQLAEWEEKTAVYVLDTGLTLWLLMLNTRAIPGNAKNGHKKHQRHLTCMKISASRVRSGRGLIDLPFKLGCFPGVSCI